MCIQLRTELDFVHSGYTKDIIKKLKRTRHLLCELLSFVQRAFVARVNDTFLLCEKNKCLKKIDAITELLRPAFSALFISIFVCYIKNNFVSKFTHPLVVTNSCRLSSNKINCGKTHQNNMNINGCVLQCQL